MYCPLMLSKMSLWSGLMTTLFAGVFDSFMYCPLVLHKVSLCSCLILALSARMFDSIMCTLHMAYQTLFLKYLMATYIATVHCIFFMNVSILNIHHCGVFNLLLPMVTEVFILSILVDDWGYNEVSKQYCDHSDNDANYLIIISHYLAAVRYKICRAWFP